MGAPSRDNHQQDHVGQIVCPADATLVDFMTVLDGVACALDTVFPAPTPVFLTSEARDDLLQCEPHRRQDNQIPSYWEVPGTFRSQPGPAGSRLPCTGAEFTTITRSMLSWGIMLMTWSPSRIRRRMSGARRSRIWPSFLEDDAGGRCVGV